MKSKRSYDFRTKLLTTDEGNGIIRSSTIYEENCYHADPDEARRKARFEFCIGGIAVLATLMSS